MKQHYLYLAMFRMASVLLLPVIGYCQVPLESTPNRKMNYVAEQTTQARSITSDSQIASATVEQVLEQITYMDGLGRPIQLINTKGSPSYADFVQPVWYDQFGRESKQYLPYTAPGQPGGYKSNAIRASGAAYTGSGQFQFYQSGPAVATDVAPFAETVFELSPLNRVLKQGAPGTDWQPSTSGTYDVPQPTDHSVKKAYTFNGLYEVILFDYDETNKRLSLDDKKYYPVNQLQVSKTKDEEQHEVIEYVDKEGHIILKKVQTEEDGLTVYAETYYVYDDFGNLVMVLPPEAMKRVKSILTPEP